jgi:hypothetical protein
MNKMTHLIALFVSVSCASNESETPSRRQVSSNGTAGDTPEEVGISLDLTPEDDGSGLNLADNAAVVEDFQIDLGCSYGGSQISKTITKATAASSSLPIGAAGCRSKITKFTVGGIVFNAPNGATLDELTYPSTAADKSARVKRVKEFPTIGPDALVNRADYTFAILSGATTNAGYSTAAPTIAATPVLSGTNPPAYTVRATALTTNYEAATRKVRCKVSLDATCAGTVANENTSNPSCNGLNRNDLLMAIVDNNRNDASKRLLATDGPRTKNVKAGWSADLHFYCDTSKGTHSHNNIDLTFEHTPSKSKLTLKTTFNLTFCASGVRQNGTCQ